MLSAAGPPQVPVCAVCKLGGVQYILSNYHVFEADIVAGGNSRVATAGDPVIQPGLIDVRCSAAKAQNVATLVVSKSLPGSNVDDSIAAVESGMVRMDGSILRRLSSSNQFCKKVRARLNAASSEAIQEQNAAAAGAQTFPYIL